ncbi:MAG: Jag N-terminal domain-containing protein [Candidatus Eisenbacteria bacterium]
MAKGSVYEGKTQDEAVRKGLEALGLQRAEATITTVEEGKSGFLGFGARPFRVSISRRPGGAIREPEETRTPERRSTRAGRDERGGGRSGRGGREERPVSSRGERVEKVEKGDKVERTDKGGRGERGGRGGREPREDRKGADRKPEPVRAEAVAEELAPRPERVERPERAARPERGERRGRGGREAREPREERRVPPPAAASPAPVQSGNGPLAESDEDGAAGERRRRRRGRRGGRGRRRDGRPEGSASTHATPETDPAAVNGAVRDHAEAAAGPERQGAPAPAPLATSQSASIPPSYEPEAVATRASSAPAPTAMPVHAAPAPVSYMPRPTPHHEEPDMGSEELATSAKRVTEDLLKAMGFEATITAKADADRVDVTVQVTSGEDLLNGNKGETRQALQHLLNRFVNTGEGSRYHLQLEINDFWQQREKELEDMALRMAEEALAENAEKVTDFMNSQERRIVHVTLKPDSRVKTYALGNGMVKRVAIAPADFPERTQEDAG